MNPQIIIAMAVAPGIFWLWYFYQRDTLEPEPRGQVLKIFLWGAFSALPAIFLEIPFGGLSLLSTVVVAPLVEELCKFYVVKTKIYDHDEFDEPMDGIVYGTAAALGFASAENILYLMAAYYAPESLNLSGSAVSSLWSTFVLRAVLSVPGHALWGAIWGYALGLAKFGAPRTVIGTGVVLAILLHGAFNFLVSTHLLMGLGLFVLIPLMWGMVNRRIAVSLRHSPHRDSPKL
ncbi:MAG: protease PrsW [Gemmatimonadetes bacterium]|nr:MAG: protease PrsW [Gemmatimonadota bacterium]